MFINLIAIILNVILHYTFIIGLNMGVKGAAIAVDISTFFLMILLVFYVVSSKVYIDTWNGK
jgi:Na+-driven multidrug efflux pump